MSQPSVFISYSHKDEEWKDRLVQHLRVLADEQGFDVWDDRRIEAGADWKAEIERAILSADVAVMLVSVDFLTSAFIKGKEIPPLLRLRKERQLEVLPIIVGDCPWRHVGWLSAMNARPKDGQSLEGMSRAVSNTALARIAEELGGKLARAAERRARAATAPAPPPVEPPRPAPIAPAPAAPAPALEAPRDPPRRGAPAPAPEAPPEPPRPAAPAPAPEALPDPQRPRPVAAPVEPQLGPKPVVSPRSKPREHQGRRSLPTLLGAAARSLPVWLIGLTVVGIGVVLWIRTRPETGSAHLASTASPVPGAEWVVWPEGVTPSSFSFESVTVDERGGVIGREKRTAPAFTEWLDGVALEMVAIPGGTFVMGSPAGEAEREGDEGPQRTVTVAPFFMGKFEVTQAQWRVAARWPRVSRALDDESAYFKGETLPVEAIFHADAVEFCARLSQRTSRAYRLPSEAEWEYAARGGTTAPFHFGLTVTPDLANYDGNHPYGQAAKGASRQRTTPAGSFGVANSFGLFDVHGNVGEMVLDPWHHGYAGAPSDGSVWKAGWDGALRLVQGKPWDGSLRLERGGSWSTSASRCRSAKRSVYFSDTATKSVGFRVLCSVARTR